MSFLFPVAVALAGGLGAVLRLLLSRWIGALPWGILTANTIASLIMGTTLSFAGTDPALSGIIATGICGGMSTFSTFSAQSVEYFKSKQAWRGVLNILLNLVVPTAAALAGVFLMFTLLK
ncbi:MAG: fluoride efflux transporter FluC [Rhodoluna sp.]